MTYLFNKAQIPAVLATLALALALNPAPASAQTDFDITVKHNINGRALGLEKELPVDVYLNGTYAFTFTFGDSVSTSLPADIYDVEVKLAGSDTVVMSLPPTPIPAGVDVTIRATLSANKSPILRVGVK